MQTSLKEFQALLKEKVIGQDKAVETITTAIFKYVMKLNARDFGQHFSGATSVLLLGPSGSGKTFITQQAADLMDIPYIEINSKSINQEGWHGKSFIDQIEHAIAELKFEYNRQINGAIIFIDEFDKLTRPNISSSSEDVNYHLQTSLLKYIEGMKVQTRTGSINFNNSMFVLAGAFVGLKTEADKNIGFNQDQSDAPTVTNALIQYGVLPELAGRIQEVCTLNKLTKKNYRKIVESEHFVLYKWAVTLNKLGIKLEWKLNDLIRYADKTELGARGLIQAAEHVVTKAINKNLDRIDLNAFTVLGI